MAWCLFNFIVVFNLKVVTVHNELTSIIDGVFTCKREGIYKFQVYSCSLADYTAFLEIYKNDTLLVSLFGHTSKLLSPTGNVVIVHLGVGDTVRVKTKDTPYLNYLWGDYHSSTFTGLELGSEPLCKYKKQRRAIGSLS